MRSCPEADQALEPVLRGAPQAGPPSLGLAEVAELGVLEPHECAAWQAEVLALRAQWTPRHPTLPFFTLGLAAYLDFSRQGGQPAAYRSPGLRAHYNALLARHFGPLLEACRVALSAHSGLHARFAPERSALPGFHIHLPHPVFAGEVASIHRDLQFRDVFPEVPTARDDVMTFTVPISLPPGSGINFWAGSAKRFLAYHLGRMLVHDGLATHQAVLHPQHQDVPRIMLQGHALRQGDALVLYW
jgi:hypothetical protein